MLYSVNILKHSLHSQSPQTKRAERENAPEENECASDTDEFTCEGTVGLSTRSIRQL